MKPAPFDYTRAASVSEAVQALRAADGEGKLIAGGQSLTPILALRLSRPKLLIDINDIPGLSRIRHLPGGRISIGALVRHRALERQRHHPLLATAAPWIGHSAIRSRGTFGGSLAHADPAAELPIIATATDAIVHIHGADSSRSIPVEDLLVGPLDTTLTEDEMITSIDLVVPHRWGFAEFSRRHGDFGLVTVAVAEIEGRTRVAVGGVAGTPYRDPESERTLGPGRWSEATIDQTARALTAGIEPTPDVHSTAEYRKSLAQELVRRALRQTNASHPEELE